MQLKPFLRKFIPSPLRRGAIIERTKQTILANATIRGGPFAGMMYTRKQVGAPLLPKLIGTYEIELAPLLCRIEQLGFDTMVDVGAGEGYYAVGLALKNPRAKIVAFEENEVGMEAIREVARLNDVADRVSVRGRCGIQELAIELARADVGFLMVDVEGFEEELLNPEALPALRGWHILFESHDLFIPGIGRRICDRFSATHTIEEIRSKPRSLADITFLSRFTKHYAVKYCLAEWTLERPEPMSWYYLNPKH